MKRMQLPTPHVHIQVAGIIRALWPLGYTQLPMYELSVCNRLESGQRHGETMWRQIIKCTHCIASRTSFVDVGTVEWPRGSIELSGRRRPKDVACKSTPRRIRLLSVKVQLHFPKRFLLFCMLICKLIYCRKNRAKIHGSICYAKW